MSKVNLERKSKFEKSLMDFAVQHFGFSGKWDAISEKKIYTKEDKYIADQAKGNTPETANLYLKVGNHWEYVCEIGEQTHKQLGFKILEIGLHRLKRDFEDMWKRENKDNKIHLPN